MTAEELGSEGCSNQLQPIKIARKARKNGNRVLYLRQPTHGHSHHRLWVEDSYWPSIGTK